MLVIVEPGSQQQLRLHAALAAHDPVPAFSPEAAVVLARRHEAAKKPGALVFLVGLESLGLRDTLRLCADLQRTSRTSQIVVLTVEADAVTEDAVFNAGAFGYCEDVDEEQIAATIVRAAAAGRIASAIQNLPQLLPVLPAARPTPSAADPVLVARRRRARR